MTYSGRAALRFMADELERVATDPDRWEALWRHSDGSYWIEAYPESERHGGGAPNLERVGSADADRFLARVRGPAS